ncbi:MAG: hypothetical protein NTZ89_05110 [Actinobacteria bacterium]|nr:hypothetical protein [Actinomycetota bacterium]
MFSIFLSLISIGTVSFTFTNSKDWFFVGEAKYKSKLAADSTAVVFLVKTSKGSRSFTMKNITSEIPIIRI